MSDAVKSDTRESDDELLAVLAGGVLALAAIAVALPALLVALPAWAVVRLARLRWWWAVLAGAAGLGIAVLVDRGLAVAYGHGLLLAVHLRSVHGIWPVAVHFLPLAIPAGVLLAGIAEAGPLRRREPVSGDAEAGPLRRSATKAELKRLAEGEGIPLGKARGLTLRAPRDTPVAVIAQPGSGKTRGLVLPAVVSWKGVVVVTSTKPDVLVDGTFGTGALGWRQTVGRCWVFDPAGQSGFPCLRWSPLNRAATWRGALAAAHAMASAAGRGQGEDGTAQFFATRGTDALAPLLHAAAVAGLSMRTVFDWAHSGDADEPRVLLEEFGASQGAISAIDNLKVGSESSLADTLATVSTLLSPWQDDEVVERTAGGVWTVADLLAGDNSLFILGGEASLRPMIAALLDEVMAELAAAAVRAGGRLSRPVLVALDEVANVGVGDGLPSWLATMRASGTQFLTSWQTTGQMERVFGRTGPREILASSPTQLWWPSNDGDSMAALVRRCGQVSVRQVSESLVPGAKQPTRTVSATQLDALDLYAFAAQSSPVLTVTGIPPVLVAPLWADRARGTRRRVAIPPDRERLASEAEADALAAEDARLPPDDEDDEPLPGCLSPEIAELAAIRFGVNAEDLLEKGYDL